MEGVRERRRDGHDAAQRERDDMHAVRELVGAEREVGRAQQRGALVRPRERAERVRPDVERLVVQREGRARALARVVLEPVPAEHVVVRRLPRRDLVRAAEPRAAARARRPARARHRESAALHVARWMPVLEGKRR